MTQKSGKSTFTPQQLKDAMMHLEEVFERCLCPFLLLGETALGVYKNPDGDLSLSCLECGVKKQHFTQSTKSLFDLVVPDAELKDDVYHFTLQGIPVRMRIIQGEYDFLKYPDMHHYYVGEFLLPNPFEAYVEHGEVK